MSEEKVQKNLKTKSNRSHLSIDDRRMILEGICEGKNQKQIADSIGVAKTTITREILKHRKFFENHRLQNDRCAFVESCDIKHLCKDMKCATKCKNCKFGKNCHSLCAQYKKRKCNKTDKFPYVCNGCKQMKICQLDFWKYNPDTANTEAETTLVNSRRGINMSEEEFAKLDATLLAGTQKGQSVEHIVTTNNIAVSPGTVRNYIKQGITTVKRIDMPRAVTYKPRQKNVSKEQQENSRKAKIGRDYSAFLNYANNVPFLFFTQIDTVEGGKSQKSKVRLLTLIVVRAKLFYCILLPDGTSKSVKKAFDDLYKKLGHDDFKFLFGVILTDNGREFSSPVDIEIDSETGRARSKVFFCNPYTYWEKGAIEASHELLRRIVPKGSDLSNLNDEKVKLINDHINSYIRDCIDLKSAYDNFIDSFGDKAANILKKLNIDRIEPKDVILHPSLIKSKN